MAQLSTQLFGDVGISPIFTAADVAGDTFKNDGIVYLFVTNNSASTIDVTVTAAKECDQGFLHDLTVSVSAGTTEQIGPLSSARFNDNNNNVSVTYSDATNVEVAVVKVQ
jgi:hypothetical protein